MNEIKDCLPTAEAMRHFINLRNVRLEAETAKYRTRLGEYRSRLAQRGMLGRWGGQGAEEFRFKQELSESLATGFVGDAITTCELYDIPLTTSLCDCLLRNVDHFLDIQHGHAIRGQALPGTSARVPASIVQPGNTSKRIMSQIRVTIETARVEDAKKRAKAEAPTPNGGQDELSKPFVFISCGQYALAEKNLGNSIAGQVRAVTGLGAFFAEQVQDLNGLDSNILNALRDCVGFIVVMHPRGTITLPDGSSIVRASVWIEQEIAIATYIRRVENKELRVIAFIHESVGREGIRDLVHLNPTPFRAEEDVIAALKGRLEDWKQLAPSGVGVELRVDSVRNQDGHRIRQLAVSLSNNSTKRITGFNCEVRVPAGILLHSSAVYPGETNECDAGFRCFRRNEDGIGTIAPRSKMTIFLLDYCTECAIETLKDHRTIAALLVEEYEISATVWIDGREYGIRRTIKELAKDSQ